MESMNFIMKKFIATAKKYILLNMPISGERHCTEYIVSIAPSWGYVSYVVTD